MALDGVRVGGAGAVDGVGRTMGELLNDKKPGDGVKVMISRRGAVRELEVLLGKKPERSFAIRPTANPTPLESTILKDWMRE